MLAKQRPRLIQSDNEFDRLAAQLETLDLLQETHDLSPEELELQALLAHLCAEYEDRTVPPPDSSPFHE